MGNDWGDKKGIISVCIWLYLFFWNLKLRRFVMMIDIRQEYENNVNKIKSVKDIKHVVGKLEGGSTSKGSIYVYFFFFFNCHKWWILWNFFLCFNIKLDRVKLGRLIANKTRWLVSWVALCTNESYQFKFLPAFFHGMVLVWRKDELWYWNW